MKNSWTCLLAVAPVVLLCGCGSDTPQTVRVTGRVTFDGRPPPGSGSVYFLPTEAAQGFPSRPATGDFGADGKYSAKTFDPGDGLLPGKYIIHIECWETPPNMEGKPAKSHVPQKYQSAEMSGFKLEITADMGSQEADFDILTR